MAEWNPWQFLVSTDLRRRLGGVLFGEQLPPRRPPPNVAEEARTYALEGLADYLREIVFQRITEGNATVPYQLPRDRVLVEWPENADNRALLPRVEFEPGLAEYLTVGTMPNVYEETWHRFGRDTVLVGTHDYQERVTLGVWASTRFQRRMLCAGIEQMLSAVIEQAPGIRLKLPRYYDQVAIFQLLERMNVDDEDAARRRRRSHIVVELRVPLVRLVNAQQLTTLVTVYTSDEAGPVPQS
jgi:hypothetical protein